MAEHVVVRRTVTIAPALETMAELYKLSREGGPKSERFTAYVKRVEHEWGLVSFNPMAGAAALEAVQQAIALGAEQIALVAAGDTISECEYTGDTVTLAVVVASAGMWTDRLATEIEYRTTAKRRADHGQVILWSREAITAEDVRCESVAETVRTMWTALHGQARTLRTVLAREGLAYALADPKSIAQPENGVAITDALEILGESTTLGDIVAVLYGDAVADQMGWPPLGISDRGGAKWAAQRAKRMIAEIGEAAALRAG
jgi:hypothetical protein